MAIPDPRVGDNDQSAAKKQHDTPQRTRGRSDDGWLQEDVEGDGDQTLSRRGRIPGASAF